MTATTLANGCKFVRFEDAGRFNVPPGAIAVHAGLIDELKPGDYVKLTVSSFKGSEKFWCEFVGYDDKTNLMDLKVSNDLVNTMFHGLRDGDEIKVDKQYLCVAMKG